MYVLQETVTASTLLRSQKNLMLVTVKLFASLSRFSPGGLPGTPFTLELPDSSTIQTLIDLLGIPPEETKVAFINGLIKEVDWVLVSGDEIGIFPPVGGG